MSPRERAESGRESSIEPRRSWSGYPQNSGIPNPRDRECGNQIEKGDLPSKAPSERCFSFCRFCNVRPLAAEKLRMKCAQRVPGEAALRGRSTRSDGSAWMRRRRSCCLALVLLSWAGSEVAAQCGHWGARTSQCTEPCTSADQCYDYALTDRNTDSPTFGTEVGPSLYKGRGAGGVTVHYFGHQA
eukprot:COSAG02_NODE_6276_length_3686_cov_2.296627_6_plen_186_part_00